MKKEETFYEPFSPLESDGNESIFLNPEKTLKITITDGNDTLREGIDYRTVYMRGHGDTRMSWLMVTRGREITKICFFVQMYTTRRRS